MDDFIFGTLATDALRQAHVRALRAGITHRSARLPLDPLPEQPIEIQLTVGPAHESDRAWVYWSTGGEDPRGSLGVAQHGQVLPLERVGVEWDTWLWGYRTLYRAVLPGQPAGTVLRYYLSAGTLTGEETLADGGAMYGIYVDDDPTPAWAQEAVVYHIFVDRFFPGAGRSWLHPATPSGFYGGTLRGVTEKLDWIASLGVTALWLMPIFPSPSHHGYDATHLFQIEPRLGTKDDLRQLLEEAHQRGLRVLLDFVPNHVSSGHETFREAQSDPRSPYVAWYTFNRWPDEYETFFGVKDLPQLNLRHPAARQYMLDAAAYWLELGVDGFRVDYAIGPTPDFWADFRRVTRAARPDCWTFGEVVEPSDSQLAFTGLLDGCLDFMLLEAIRQTFAFGRWQPGRFIQFLEQHQRYFPPGFTRPSFLDNHDMNRYLWAVQGDQRRLKMAALCQFTLAGPPVIYYGTEAGLSQERDVRQDGRGIPEESRLPMPWETQDAALLDFYRKLVHLRRSEPVYWTGEFKSLVTGPDSGVLVYARQRQAGSPSLLTVINLAESARHVTLDDAWDQVALATEPGLATVVSGGQTQLDLPPLSGAVLRSSLLEEKSQAGR